MRGIACVCVCVCAISGIEEQSQTPTNVCHVAQCALTAIHRHRPSGLAEGFLALDWPVVCARARVCVCVCAYVCVFEW